MKTIRRFSDETKAQAALALLTNAGIQAILTDDETGAPEKLLQVPEEDAGRAMGVLEQHAEFALLPKSAASVARPLDAEDDEPAVKPIGVLGALGWTTLCMLAVAGIVWGVLTWVVPEGWMEDANRLVQKGNAEVTKNDYPKALSYYNAALRADPTNAGAYYGRGLIYAWQGENEKALADFNLVVKLSPESMYAYGERGMVLYKLKKYDEALSDFNQVIDLDAGNFRGYASRAMVYSAKGEVDKAMEDYNLVLSKDPGNVMTMNDMAWLYATYSKDSVRDGKKAVELAMKACEGSKWDNSAYIDTLAAAEAEAGNFDDAVKYQQQAVEKAKGEKIEADELRKMQDRITLYGEKKPYRDLDDQGI